MERSRTDPNMLVITYTSEHNHPWPTQRNALAGSTRSHQPLKNNIAPPPPPSNTKGASSSSSSSPTSYSQPQNHPKASSSSVLVTNQPREEEQEEEEEEEQEEEEENNIANNKERMMISTSTSPDNLTTAISTTTRDGEDGVLLMGHLHHHQSYGATLAEDDLNRSEDFFSELGEIEIDPLDNLLLRNASTSSRNSIVEQPGEGRGEEKEQGKALDPFIALLDWTPPPPPGDSSAFAGGEAKY